jgi:hypothetical protein
MKKPFTRTIGLVHRLRQLGLTALLAGGATVAAQAQTLNYSTATASNVAGTYTDLGATGTAIVTSNTDDANSAAQEIGFAFAYNGANFTQFVLNTNGVLRLGSAAPSTAALYYDNNSARTSTDPLASTNAADVNLLMPFNQDLVPGSGAGGADYRVLTSGTAPNRVCTIQWRNVADKAGAGDDVANVTQYASFSFQVKLYETTNLIEFVYGTATAGAGAAGTRFPNVGLKGSGLATGQLLLALKPTTTAWSATTFQNVNYGTVAHNITKGTLPTTGRTYRFALAPANDAAVTAIYTLGKIATNSALPHAVQAVISNAGTAAQTNVVATLNVTGANTFTATQTVAVLAAGASTTVTFAAYPTTFVAGTNAVTVTVPADGNAANNTATYGQLVTADRVSYINPNITAFGGTVGVGSPGGALVTKYTLPAATVVSDVTLSFGASTSATTTYQVVLYDANGVGGVPGNILFTSATQTRTAAASTPIIPIPTIAVPATFYIGVKELDNNPGLNYQTEDPLKPNTYYYSLDGATSWVSLNTTTLKARLAIEYGTVVANCSAPTAVTISNTTTTGATVAFTPAAGGVSSYQVVYGPTGFNPSAGGTTVTTTTSPVVLTGLTSATSYQVYVRSNCASSGTSIFTMVTNFFTACNPNAVVSTYPYNQSFDTLLAGQALPCGITTLDANGDGATWRLSAENPNSGTYAMRYQGVVVNNTAADDWFFTPPLALPGTAGTRYQVAFRYRAAGVGTGTSTYTESLEVKSGLTATAAGQTNLLYTNPAINNLAYNLANGTSTPVVAYLPAGASTQYVGFHVKSAANQSNLYIDDLSVTAVVITATSPALMQAVTVFPNPSTTGVFDLEIHGANAQKGLEVEVVNNLGQRVYVGTARDNFTNPLDLSRLATGLYHLKVRAGDNYMLRQISIVK